MPVNLLANKDEIKQSLLKKASQLWGLNNLRDMDPLVSLMIESISYELSKTGQSITASNNKMLEQLANMMVTGDKGLSKPSHAVLRVEPLHNGIELLERDQFYLPNGLAEASNGKIQGDIYFSPVRKTALFPGKINWIVSGNKASEISDEGQKLEMFKAIPNKRLPDREVWLGIELNELNENLSTIDLYLDTPNDQDVNKILRFNSLIQMEVYHPSLGMLSMDIEKKDEDGKEEGFSHKNKESHLKEIHNNYNNKFISFRRSGEELELNNNALAFLPEKLKGLFNEGQIELMKTKLLWLKLSFPPVFERSFVEKINLFLNCIVVANRKLNKVQHNIERSGTVLSLEPEQGEQFLKFNRILDKYDRHYQDLPSVNTKQLKEGSYKVYYGSLESFDETKGVLALEQIIYKIREEGNSFSSLGMDSILNDLEEIYAKLNSLENKIDRKKKMSQNYRDFYLLVNPYSGTNWLDYEYWSTNGTYANFIPEGTYLQQYRTKKPLNPNGIRLMSRTIGGVDMLAEESKVHHFRHQILSKERLVSKSDIKYFIHKEVGNYIESIEIVDGVEIDPNPKRGLSRITKILLIPKDYSMFLNNEWEVITNGLQDRIIKIAITSLNYRVEIKEEM